MGGGGGQRNDGGDMASGMSRLLGQPQQWGNYQQVAINPPHEGGNFIWGDRNVDFPGADYTDNPVANNALSNIAGWGLNPSQGFGGPAFGPTQSPTWWVNYPGVGNVPMAIPPSGWSVDPAQKGNIHTIHQAANT